VTTRARWALALSSLALGACVACSGGASSKASPAPAGIGQEVGDIGHDLPIVKRAEAAANEVVRATGDCDAIKEALPNAQAVVDEALSQVRTGASRTAITSLKKQMNDVAGACP
jgi:hypothetical protein